MKCKSCGADNQSDFTGEVAIHCPGLKNIDKPPVFVFPQFHVCLDCGTVEFVIREAELHLLAKCRSTAPDGVGRGVPCGVPLSNL